jgi:hypothetical protein
MIKKKRKGRNPPQAGRDNLMRPYQKIINLKMSSEHGSTGMHLLSPEIKLQYHQQNK